MREQIVSISTHETTIENGDAILVLVYKKKQDSTMTSLASLQYHIIRNTAPWEEHFEEAMKLASSRCEVVALTHTPRNLGQMNVQILWYLTSNASFSTKVKHITNEFADWETLL